jgi:hypothetical protein
LICLAPGDATQMEHSSWFHSDVLQFPIEADGYVADIYITAYGPDKREMMCKRVVVQQQGFTQSVTYPECPPLPRFD